MKRTFILLVVLSLLFLSCGEKEKKVQIQDGADINTDISSGSSAVQEEESSDERISKSESSVSSDEYNYDGDESFFKGGVKTINGKEVGIYVIEKGDHIWKISIKYLEQYQKKQKYDRIDIGNVSYAINKANYKEMFGGVNDWIRIGNKIKIPIDEIKEIQKSSYDKKVISEHRRGSAFFRGGTRSYKGKEVGVYFVIPDDNIWVIANNYLTYYKQKDGYEKKELVSVVDDILLLNYKKKADGSIEPELHVRNRIYIPLDS
jgi:LysM repeat protein